MTGGKLGSRSRGLAPKGDFDQCTWCACSVFTFSEKVDRGAQLRKLPRLKSRRHVAYVHVTSLSGVGLVNTTSGHISWWIYSDYDPLQAIKKVEAII